MGESLNSEYKSQRKHLLCYINLMYEVSQCSSENNLSNQKVHLRPSKSHVTNSILTLFRMSFFGAAHGWGEGGIFGV